MIRRPMLARHREGPAFVLAALLFLAVGGLLPVALSLWDIAGDPAQGMGALTSGILWGRFATSLLICLYTLAIMVPLGMLQAWFLVRTDLPLRHILLAIAPIPFFIPPLVHVLTWFRIVPLEGTAAVVLVYILSYQPLALLMAARSMEQTGRDEIDALVLQGGRLLVFLHDMRGAFPSAMIGGILALVFILSDFAVVDFLTSIGPKVTVYADTLYSHHLGGRGAAVAAASLPGLVLCMLLLAWALRLRRAIGQTTGAHHVTPRPLALGRWSIPAVLLLFVLILPGSVVPLASLAWQTGSTTVLVEEFMVARHRLLFSILIAAAGATVMVLVAIPLAHLARLMRRPWILDTLVMLPFAAPALLFGIGLIRVWNHPVIDHIYTSFWIVVIAVAARYLAFVYLPYSGGLDRLDPCHEEAAQLEGAGPLRRFLHVVRPMLGRTLIAAWCVAFCLTLRELDTLVMLRAGQQSLTFHLYSNVVFAREDQVAAIALILLMVTMAPLFLFLLVTGRRARLV
ncbi:MAG: iron ABC transporter permease [Candidatus Sumerlaeia bacterium]|nr:iron ABC transporter permease [Candidatus Sumerlaeia bacterium]